MSFGGFWSVNKDTRLERRFPARAVEHVGQEKPAHDDVGMGIMPVTYSVTTAATRRVGSSAKTKTGATTIRKRREAVFIVAPVSWVGGR